MDHQQPPLPRLLCLAGYEKGHEFLREAKHQGCGVVLITAANLEHAGWPQESVDEIFFLPDVYDLNAMINGVSYLARTRQFDRVVALDDFDVETAAALREHMQLPGAGATIARRFRDKLAMRVAARSAGLPVPDFVQVLNYDAIRDYFARVPPPWLLKPRAEAASVGITRLNSSDELWPLLDQLGDRQSHHLIERYLPGEVYHVDSIVNNGEVLFAEVHQYGQPPLDVTHYGGIFVTRRVPRGSADEATLRELNARVLKALGHERGIAHAEYIKAHGDGQFYFLEAAARVGGANIAETIEAATGINLWREWVKLEVASMTGAYQLPEIRQDYAGVVISLTHQEHPDTAAFADPEIVYRLEKPYHIGFVVAAPDLARVQALLDDYSQRIARDFAASLPAPDRLRVAGMQE
jgi:hypothetical protein